MTDVGRLRPAPIFDTTNVGEALEPPAGKCVHFPDLRSKYCHRIVSTIVICKANHREGTEPLPYDSGSQHRVILSASEESPSTNTVQYRWGSFDAPQAAYSG